MRNSLGKIVRMVDEIGIGYVVEEETRKEFAFPYDFIEGYRGESSVELAGMGLGKGDVVHLYIKRMYFEKRDEAVGGVRPLLF